MTDTPDPARFLREKELFLAALDVPQEERAAWIQARADDPEMAAALLARLAREERDSGSFLASMRAARTATLTESIGHPQRIGPYHILGELGRGGMGVVYRAEQREPVRRQVALKVVLGAVSGSAIATRFDLERRALASMSHRCIAKVFDVGSTPEGQPYFAMELVEGNPLTQFCNDNNLSLQDRLELFQQVCEGVQHAHNKGVVHRDLKPANILVAREGEHAIPKILDFGLVKITGGDLHESAPLSAPDRIAGTLEYMSPEQTAPEAGAMDTRTDVYALGVVLYELLAGELPFTSAELDGAGIFGALKMIRERDPERPSLRISRNIDRQTVAKQRRTTASSLRRVLATDLDWIVLRAMAKEPDRRYEAATSLAADIGRYLAHLPVLAGPPSLRYRLRKFVRRHRLPLGATIAVVLSLGIGLTLAMRATQRAETETIAKRAASARAAMELAQRLASRASWSEALLAYDQAENDGHPDRFAVELGRIEALDNIDPAAARARLAAVDDHGLDPARLGRLLMVRADLLTDWVKTPEAGLELLRRARATGALSEPDDLYAQAFLASDLRVAWSLARRALLVAPDHRQAQRFVAPMSLLCGSAADTEAAIGAFASLYPDDPMLPVLRLAVAIVDGDAIDTGRVEAAMQGVVVDEVDRAVAATEAAARFVADQRRQLLEGDRNGTMSLAAAVRVFQAVAGIAGGERRIAVSVHPSVVKAFRSVLALFSRTLLGSDVQVTLTEIDSLLPDGLWDLWRVGALTRKGDFDAALAAATAARSRPSCMSRLLGAQLWELTLLDHEATLLNLWQRNLEAKKEPMPKAWHSLMLTWATRLCRHPQPPTAMLRNAVTGLRIAGEPQFAVELGLRLRREMPEDADVRFWLSLDLARIGCASAALEEVRWLRQRDPKSTVLVENEAEATRRVVLAALPELESRLLAEIATPAGAANHDAELDRQVLRWLYAEWKRIAPGADVEARAASFEKESARSAK